MSENNVQNQAVVEQDLNEILKVRREKLAALQEQGNDPFMITKYDVTGNSKDIKEGYVEGEEKTYSVAGRIMSRRIMGKASFFHIADKTGTIQCYIRRDDVGEEEFAGFM